MPRTKKKARFGQGRRSDQRTDYTPVTRQNEKFEGYYNGLQIVPEEEKEQFWATLRRDLPNSFRFTGSRKHALAVQERLKDFFIPKITSIQYEGSYVEPPRPVSWYPDQLAWSMTTPKQVVRKFAPFASFQKFLVSETEVGNINRQEVVSMIPPLLMDVGPGMVVLDMCAAPGSKAAQIMEMIHAGEEERMAAIAEKREKVNNKDDAINAEDVALPNMFPNDVQRGAVDDDGRSTGLLIANDSDYKRAHLLIHQMKRLNSPNLMVTNHDATMYPSIKLPVRKGEDGELVTNKYLKFDRILADVPCTGDGTPRKNVNVWKDWNPSNALGLHATQSRILVRALQMLKPGGRVVYSTCSMNPVENEAVVASVIDRCGGSRKVEIVDCSDKLPGLKRFPGLTKWSVMDKQGRMWNSWEEVEENISEGSPAGRFVEGMFPPADEDEGVDLTRCMRVYPHQQDTGGFFITVLEKKSEIRARPEHLKKGTSAAAASSTKGQGNEERRSTNDSTTLATSSVTPSQAPEQETVPAENTSDSPTKRKADYHDEEVTKRQKVSDDITDAKKETPGVTPQSLPAVGTEKPEPAPSQPTQTTSEPVQKKARSGQPFEEPFKYIDPQHEELQNIFEFYGISSHFPRDRFMVRNAEGRLAKAAYYTSVLARDILTENEGSGMKFVHCGVKMFVKQDVQRADVCPWRVQTDGLQILDSWVGLHRVVKIYGKETLRRLLIEMFPKVSDGAWKDLGEIGEWARDADMGCCVLRIEPSDKEDGFNERMVFPLWRSLHSLNLMLPKEERRALLLRLFDDETPLVNTTAKQKSAKAAPTPQPRVENRNTETEVDDLPSKEEEDAIQKDNLILGQEEQDAMSARESYAKNDDEEDVMNTTV